MQIRSSNMQALRIYPFVASLVVLLQTLSFSAFADELYRIDGLSFDCAQCSVEENGYCRIVRDGSPLLVRCERALTHLLDEQLASTAEHANPTATELASFLLRSEASSPHAKRVFTLLQRTAAGRSLMSSQIEQLYWRFPELFDEKLVAGELTPALADKIWELPGNNGVSISARTRALLLATSETRKVEDLFLDLSVVDVEQDANDLVAFQEALAERKHPFQATISRIILLRQKCLSNAEAIACSLADFAELPATASRYMQRLHMHLTLQSVSHIGDLNSALEQLGQSNLTEFRTAEAHSIVSNLLEQSLASNKGIAPLSSEEKSALSTIAESDEKVALLSAKLQVRMSQQQLEAGRFALAEEALLESLDFWGVPFAERSALLDTWVAKGSPAASERMQQMLAQHAEEEAPFSPLVVLPILFVIAILYSWRMHKVRQRLLGTASTPGNDGLTSSERTELRLLLKRFGLNATVGESQLSKAYHQQAKQLHPDTGSGNANEFTELAKQYRRARSLIERRSVVNQ